MPQSPINLFISYAHDDAEYLKEFSKFLTTLKRQNLINPWADLELKAGDKWDDGIKTKLEQAKVVVFLVSQNFIASDYIYDVEMKRAIQRHEKKEIVIIPVIIKPCDFNELKISSLQALPKGAKPISTWDDQDSAWLNVVQGIRKVIEDMHTGTSAHDAKANFINNNRPQVAVDINIASPDNAQLKSQLQQLVVQGKESEAIKIMMDHAQGDSSKFNEVLLLSSRYNSTQKDINMELIAKADGEISMNRIRAALLELIQGL